MRPTRILHTMLRVADIDRSLAFYTQTLGMKLLRREDYPGDRFTFAFVGYGEEVSDPAIELTHNWDKSHYEKGTVYGHLALSVPDVYSACRDLELRGARIVRQPGPMNSISPQRAASEIIAFVVDPDGYRIELVQAELRTGRSAMTDGL